MYESNLRRHSRRSALVLFKSALRVAISLTISLFEIDSELGRRGKSTLRQGILDGGQSI